MMVKAKKNKKQSSTSGNIMAFFLATTVCVILPLLHFETTIDPVLYPRFLGWSISSLILVFLFWVLKLRDTIQISHLKNGFFISLGLFIIISIVSLVIAYNPIEGITDLMKWILVWVFSFIVLQVLLLEKNSLSILLKGMIIFASLITLVGIYQYFTKAINNPDPNALYEVKGLMAHKNQYSFSLFLVSPFLLSSIVYFENGWEKAGIVSTIMIIIMVTLLQTRAVWIATGSSFCLAGLVLLLSNRKNGFFKFQRKWLIRTGIVFAIIIAFTITISILFPAYSPATKLTSRISTIFDPEFTSNHWRVEMWDATFRMVKDNPIMGVGGGNWKISIYPYYGRYLPSVFRHWRTPHNDYLSVLSEKGILGLAAFILTLCFLLYYAIKSAFIAKSKKAALTRTFFLFGITGYMIISFFSFPNERMNHLIFFSILSAVILANHHQAKPTNKKTDSLPKTIFIPFIIILFIISIYGYQCVKSEFYIAKVQSVKDKGEFGLMETYAKKGYFRYAPIEPRFSFPIVMYQGIAEYEKKNYKAALKYFQQSYRQHPTSISVMNNLGSVFGQLGLADSSRYYQNKTLEIFPHYEIGLINLSKTFIVEKEYKEAYKAILSCNPKSTNKEIKQIRNYLEGMIN